MRPEASPRHRPTELAMVIVIVIVIVIVMVIAIVIVIAPQGFRPDGEIPRRHSYSLRVY